jgi:hypothetical protein
MREQVLWSEVTVLMRKRLGTMSTLVARFALIGVLALAALTLAGCDRAASIPGGSQVVHVLISDGRVDIEPAAVRAGDVYLVLDAPADRSMTLVARQEAAATSPEPLSEADVDRLRSGDTFQTVTTSLDAGSCSPAQDVEDRGKIGPCGNVTKVGVAVGIYAIVAGAPEPDPATGRMPPIAVLTVRPRGNRTIDTRRTTSSRAVNSNRFGP